MADHTGNITCIASSSSSSTNTGQVYDVFLNHRGPDTKKGLASHIYRRLIDRGLRVFLDHLELRKGEDMPSQINEAIRTASVHVAIFSPTYAQSSWCLDELALMVESGSTIFPVFYNVDPSELRWTRSGDLGEKGRYGRDLQGLENKTTLDPHTNKKKPRYDSSTLEKWRDALHLVSNKNGFDMNAYYGDEGRLVDAVVEEVWRKARKTASSEQITCEQLALIREMSANIARETEKAMKTAMASANERRTGEQPAGLASANEPATGRSLRRTGQQPAGLASANEPAIGRSLRRTGEQAAGLPSANEPAIGRSLRRTGEQPARLASANEPAIGQSLRRTSEQPAGLASTKEPTIGQSLQAISRVGKS